MTQCDALTIVVERQHPRVADLFTPAAAVLVAPEIRRSSRFLVAEIEIEGHTDNVRSPAVNERPGLERAEAVKRYLYEQHQIPLHRINQLL